MHVIFAAKRLQILAQGFSPGNRFSKAIALKGRPIGISCFHRVTSGAWYWVRSAGACVLARTKCLVVTDSRSVPLSGRFLAGSFPGLKPWAILLGHFMVKAGSVATTAREDARLPHQPITDR
jgi:hypothetical protein